MTFITHIECTKCDKAYSHEQVLFLCSCGAPLFVRYNLDKVKSSLTKEKIKERSEDIWRYKELLPIIKDENILNLGEGYTPIFHTRSLGRELGLNNLYIKDESLNPTGSFKARGLGTAISKAKELGINKICLPTAGNAGGAAAAYGAKGGMEVMIAMPESTPNTFKVEAIALGAKLLFVNGSIVDAGIHLKTQIDDTWYDVSTLKEPYRVEGKKTMGIEIAEQFGWELPDVIIYPTGGGTGLIGMWKAFDEMEIMGWVSSKRPRMVSVQADGCAPIVKAFHDGKDNAEEWQNPTTVAAGIRVPKAVGDFLILNVLRESGGTAVSVSDEELLDAIKIVGKHTGLFVAPEGGAAYAAVRKLKENGDISENEKIVIFNTGSGLKYTDAMKE